MSPGTTAICSTPTSARFWWWPIGSRFPWPPDWPAADPREPLEPQLFRLWFAAHLPLAHPARPWLGSSTPTYGTLESSYVVGRVLSALFDVGTVLSGLPARGASSTALGSACWAPPLTLPPCCTSSSRTFTLWTRCWPSFVLLTRALAPPALSQRPAFGAASGRWGSRLGMALATKVSAAPLALPVRLAWFLARPLRGEIRRLRPWASLGHLVVGAAGRQRRWACVLACGAATLRCCEPYALIDVVTFAIDVIHESYMARGVGRHPLYAPVYRHAALSLPACADWCSGPLGLPLGLAGLAGLPGGIGARGHRRSAAGSWLRAGLLLLPLSWVVVYFGSWARSTPSSCATCCPSCPCCACGRPGRWLRWCDEACGDRRIVGRRWLSSLSLVLGGTALYAAGLPQHLPPGAPLDSGHGLALRERAAARAGSWWSIGTIRCR